MKLECSVEKLKIAINQAERITGKNLTLPILSCILLIASEKKIKIRASNLSLGIEIEIPAKIEKEGAIVIKGDILNNILSNINQQTINLESENNNLVIKTKNHNIVLKSYSTDDFPTIPVITDNSFIIQANKFTDGLKSVYYSASNSEIKPEISSIYIYTDNNFLFFVATDSFRLAEKKIKIKQIENFSHILIPYKNVIEIIKLFDGLNDDLKININKNQISFLINNIYLTSRIIDGNFPDYNQIIPKEHKTEVIVLKYNLLNALRISNIFSDKFNQIVLKIKGKEKIFEIESQNNDVGENKTIVDSVVKGENIELNFNYKYFLDCFQSVGQDSMTLKFNGNNKPLIITNTSDDSFLYLIMPMNR